ncbi:hypothetical protein C8J57DRAFT_1507448 [Mycena rebaudengoi]|nr:hypothetical protein C8J57DRAFT_1507448 [Mycena rebaudengoi]
MLILFSTSEEESITSKDLAPSTDDDMPFLLTPIANKTRRAHVRPIVDDESDDDVEIVDKTDSSNKRKTSPPLNTGSTGSTSAVKRARTVLTDSDSSADAEPSEPNKPESHESTMTALFSPVESAKQINNKLIRPASDRNPSIASTPANNPQPVAMPDLAELIQRNFAAFIPQITDVVISRLQSNLTHGANAVVPTIVAENILPTTPATPIAPPTQTNTPASSQPVVLNTPNTKTVSFHKNVNNKDTNDKDTNKDVAPTHTSMPSTFGALFSSQADPGSESRAEDNKPDQVFLQDLETYKINFNADAKCEVFDLELQDEVLRPLYIGLPPLPGDRWIVASYDPKDRCSPEAGGRAIFSSWPKQCPNLNGTTVWNIMNFVQSGIYINPCRISPALCSTEKASAAISARRIAFENKTAISVMVGMCTLSYITEAVAGSGAEPRSKRYIHILQHNQEWERWQSFHCLVFGYDLLYSHIDNNAIQLGSILSPMTKVVKASSSDFRDVVNADMLGARSSKLASPSKPPPKSSYTYKFTPSNGPRYTLAHDEDIPAFDARGIAVDFNNDIGNLANVLPPFKGEIPTGSFVVAGYTASTYLGSVAAREKQHLMNLGCNLVWVVVCGTPIKR